jgi:hypothetical protein
VFAALCEAYLGIWPNVELFRRLIYFKTQTADVVPMVCGTASFYARKTANFPGLKGKESCKKWQRTGLSGTTGALLSLAPHQTWRRFSSGSPLCKRMAA